MSHEENADRALQDSKRISDEFDGVGAHTDPFVEAVRATRMPMIITNPRLPDNPVVFANDAFCKLTGYGRAEILGRNCRFLQGPLSSRDAIKEIGEAVKERHQIEIDIRNHKKNGEPFWNRLLLSPVYDATGELAYFFASQMDVTQEKERIHRLEASNAALIVELNEQLRQQQVNEDDLRFTLSAGRFGAWSLDLASMQLTASETCKENFGRSHLDSFTYADLVASIHPGDRQRMQEEVQACIRDRRDYSIEYRIITPKGQPRAVSIRGRTVFADDGAPLRMAGVSLDITDRVRAERMKEGLAALSELLRDLDAIGDISHAAGQVLGEALDVDRAGYGTIDAHSETITIEKDWNAPGIQTLAGTLHFRDYGSYIDDLLRGQTVAFADARTDPRTAATADALIGISAQAVVNMPVVEQGQTVALFYLNHGSVRDWRDDELIFLKEVASRTRVAVERRRAERALQEANDRLLFLDRLGREAVDAGSADEVMAVTTRLVGQHMSVSICAYADMEPDQDHFTIRGDWAAAGSSTIVGRYSLSAFGRLAVQELCAGRPLIINDNLSEIAPVEARTFQDIGITATICMPLVRDGRLTALMAIHDRVARTWTPAELTLIRDVTDRSWAHIERVRSQAQLRELNTNLETLVIERSQKLMAAEDALRQAQKMEAVGQLTGGVAHDFNNLLTIISSSVDFLRRAELPEERRLKYVAAISDTVSRASKLTNQLLAFARRQSLNPQPFNVCSQVESVLDLVRPLVGGLVDIELKKTEEIVFALADVGQFETALVNLAVNARDAMSGEGRIMMNIDEVQQIPATRSHPVRPGRFIAVTVKDNGVGIPKDKQEQIFEPFFTTKEVGQGTGLGLSQVYGFAKQSGGEIIVTSSPGEGAAFTIYLPRSEQVAVMSAPAPREFTKGNGARLLVVEDNPSVGEFLTETLHDLGFKTAWAGSAQEALHMLEGGQERFDLVFTDVIMPGMNGLDLAREIARRRPELPIVLTSGYSDVLVSNQAADWPLLRKPYSTAELAHTIAQALSGA